jgi:tetratricopeptide (TPR) repeat protein
MTVRRLPRLAVFLLVSLVVAASAGATEVDPGAAGAASTPGGRADLGAVNEMVRAQDYAGAEQALGALEGQFPDDPRVLLLRGELLLALGRPADALVRLERCAGIDPSRPRLNFQLGAAYQTMGRGAEAIAAYGREIEINQDPAVQVLARLNRAVLHEQAKDTGSAAAELEAVLALEPTRLEVYGDLASLYLESGRVDDAARCLADGRAAGFRSAGHMYSLGMRYLSANSPGPAADAFRIALEIDPQHADATRSLGVALDRLGQEAEAVQQFRNYLELRPDAPDAAKVAERIRQAEGG